MNRRLGRMERLRSNLLGLRILLVVCGALLGGAVTAVGQSITVDNVTFLKGPDTLYAGEEITFNLRYNNPLAVNLNMFNGFRVYSPDGATWDALVVDSLGLIPRSNFDLIFAISYYSADGQLADTFSIAGQKVTGPGLPAGFNGIPYRFRVDFNDKADANRHLCIDSSWYRPAGTWKWTGSGGFTALPTWSGQRCYYLYDSLNVPTYIALSEDTLHFAGLAGGPNPPSQTFTVGSIGLPLVFNLVENAPWITKSPSTGTTPRQITVGINSTGLTAGVYFDSIEVTSATALNSPQYVYVRLSLTNPPSTIGVSPTSIFFNAIAGGSNPAPQLLNITNTGGGTLDWSVSNTESWLSLFPTSGTGDGAATVSADITGLGFGTYYDTVVVSDPNATNNPVKVPVRLTVASDLPQIVVDPQNNTVIIDLPTTTTSRFLSLGNAGGGAYNFSFTESSPRIVSFTPSSGTAPATVQVDFDLSGATNGQEFFDTIYVTSPEALNSPYPVYFKFRCVDNPAFLNLSRDTMRLTVYECAREEDNLPEDFNVIANFGGDDPMAVSAVFESDYFTLNDTDVVAGFTYYAKALPPTGLSAGVYLDTITFVAEKAINAPRRAIVKYTVLPTVQPPLLQLTKSAFSIPLKEDEGPTLITSQAVNARPGCMNWSYTEDVDWYNPISTAGTSRGVIAGTVDPTGLTRGFHRDSFYVVSPGADGSPAKLRLELRVWVLYGDFDWDGVIDGTDLQLYVDYFFFSGPGPQPEYRVGDLDCDEIVDATDLAAFVDYLFYNGPSFCGNPF